MKKFSDLTKINEMKYGQPMYGEDDLKQHMKDLLVAASDNDQRVLKVPSYVDLGHPLRTLADHISFR